MSRGIELLCDSHHGVFIPQIMIDRLVDAGWTGLESSDIRVLRYGPEHEEYWEAWDYILSYAGYVDENGNNWELYQDGDLWAVCTALMTDEEYDNFFRG